MGGITGTAGALVPGAAPTGLLSGLGITPAMAGIGLAMVAIPMIAKMFGGKKHPG